MKHDDTLDLFQSAFSVSFFSELGFCRKDFEDFEMQFEFDEEQCQKCQDFNKMGTRFPTNHSTTDCLRCGICKTWTKTSHQYYSHLKTCNGKQPCKFFAGGFCKNGSHCEFSHGEFKQKQSSQRLVKKQRNIFMRERCVFFDGTGCKKGDDCPYKHGPDPCVRCGGESHDVRHCAQCFTCQKWGHIAADCQEK